MNSWSEKHIGSNLSSHPDNLTSLGSTGTGSDQIDNNFNGVNLNGQPTKNCSGLVDWMARCTQVGGTSRIAQSAVQQHHIVLGSQSFSVKVDHA